jgi:hypothetical protein
LKNRFHPAESLRRSHPLLQTVSVSVSPNRPAVRTRVRVQELAAERELGAVPETVKAPAQESDPAREVEPAADPIEQAAASNRRASFGRSRRNTPTMHADVASRGMSSSKSLLPATGQSAKSQSAEDWVPASTSKRSMRFASGDSRLRADVANPST